MILGPDRVYAVFSSLYICSVCMSRSGWIGFWPPVCGLVAYHASEADSAARTCRLAKKAHRKLERRGSKILLLFLLYMESLDLVSYSI